MWPEHHSIMSPSRRIAGSIGKHHSFWAMYSLRMSAWIVPARCSGGDALLLGGDHVVGEHDRRGRVDRHRHRHIAERDAGEQRLHVVERVDGHALAADLAQRPRMVGVVAHQRRHVEGRRQAGLPLVEQVAEALVGLLGRPEARELAHRPEAPAVHRRVDAARERIAAGQPDLALVGHVGLGVERLDLDAAQRREGHVALAAEGVGLAPFGFGRGEAGGSRAHRS